MRTIKAIIFLTIFLVSIFFVYAVDFDADIAPIKDRIKFGEEAQFKLTITNNEATRQTFEIPNADYPKWNIFSADRISPITVDIAPNSSATITILITPTNEKYVAQQGSYLVRFQVIAKSTGETFTFTNKPIVSMTTTTESKGYVADVGMKTDFPEKVDPRDELNFKITLTNRNKLNIKDAKLVISSQFINEEIKIELAPEEEKTIEVKKQFDLKTEPMQDSLKIRLLYQDKDVFIPFEKKYEVTPYSDLTDVTTKNEYFLRADNIVTFTNKGNLPFKGNLSVKTTWLKSIFTSTVPKAALAQKGKEYYYTWNADIPPYNTFQVNMKENYLGLGILALAFIAILIVMLFKRKPVAITKEVVEKEIEEGSFSHAKIQVTLRNEFGKKITDISIVDKLPQLLHLEKDDILGTMKPTKIVKNSHHQTLVVWNIDALEVGEERVITYFVKSNLKIIGGLTLFPAVAKFKLDDKETTIKSKPIEITY